MLSELEFLKENRMKFDFFIAPNCYVCQEIWPKIRRLLGENNIEHDLHTIRPEDGQLLVYESFLKTPITRKVMCGEEELDIPISSFPTSVFTVEGETFVIAGSGIYDVILKYVKEEALSKESLLKINNKNIKTDLEFKGKNRLL